MPKKLTPYQRFVRRINEAAKAAKRKFKQEHRGRPKGSKNKPKKRGRPKKR